MWIFFGKSSLSFLIGVAFTFQFVVELSNANRVTRSSAPFIDYNGKNIQHFSLQLLSKLTGRDDISTKGPFLVSKPRHSLNFPIRKLDVLDHLHSIRGGAGTPSPTKKKKSKKRSKNNSTRTSSLLASKQKQSKTDSKEGFKEGKQKIGEAMKESDSAKLLGEAIRDRKDILQNDPILPPQMDINDIDASLLSLGLSLGTSDPRSSFSTAKKITPINSSDQHDTYDSNILDGGGVEAPRTSILANYFLQSHGGAYAFQCTVSALSVVMGLVAILLPSLPFLSSHKNVSIGILQIVFLRRSLLFALLKHASGLLAAAILSARRIPEIGLYKTRKLIEELASDPVAQYLFYCALLLVWLPVHTITSKPTGSNAETVSPLIPWFLSSKLHRPTLVTFLGPILLREIIHSAWVIYDVCIILGSSSTASPLLKICKGSLDAFMSILLTPGVWRKADSRRKQHLLAKMVSRASLSLEICAGAIILIDGLRSLFHFSLSPLDNRPKLSDLLKKVFCVRLYINYMLVRKKKIISLAGTIRGGASHVPERIIDLLLEPKRTMGILENYDVKKKRISNEEATKKKKKWINFLGDALGIK